MPSAKDLKPPEPFMRLDGVSRSYGGASAVSNLAFSLAKGDKMALLGPNGAGKSTLLKLIAGAITPDAGKILVKGMDPWKARALPGFLGWLPEKAPLNPELTVREHLELAGELRKLGKAETRREIDRLSEALDLGEKLPRLAGRLSLGTRRQAAVAAALLGSPELLLLDEPSSSLDPDEAAKLSSILKKLPKTTTMILSSHMLGEAHKVTKGAVFLKGGAMKGAGTWEKLAADFSVESPKDSPEHAEEIFFKALGGQ
jgi:ABC-2 type transport system ATP-binding protein